MLGSNLSLGTSRLISSSKSEAAPSNKILGNNPPVSYADSPLYTKGPLYRTRLPTIGHTLHKPQSSLCTRSRHEEAEAVRQHAASD